MIWLSDHAIQRAKERLGMSENYLSYIANKAYLKGHGINDTYGKLKKWLIKKQNDNITEIKIYDNIIFVFRENRLISVYILRLEFHGFLLQKSNIYYNEQQA